MHTCCYALVHSLNTHSSLYRVRLKLWARNIIQISPTTWELPLHYLPYLDQQKQESWAGTGTWTQAFWHEMWTSSMLDQISTPKVAALRSFSTSDDWRRDFKHTPGSSPILLATGLHLVEIYCWVTSPSFQLYTVRENPGRKSIMQIAPKASSHPVVTY